MLYLGSNHPELFPLQYVLYHLQKNVEFMASDLLGSGYDRNTDYWLVMKDAEDGSELARIAFKIDVVFGLDFEF